MKYFEIIKEKISRLNLRNLKIGRLDFRDLLASRLDVRNLSVSNLDIRSLLATAASLQAEKYKPFLIVMFMTAVIYAGVGIFYKVIGLQLMGRISGGPAPPAATAASPGAAKEAFDAYKIIMDRNLLGSTDKTVAEKQMAGKANEPGDLTQVLVLKGTVAGDSRYGFAIIEEKGKNKQVLYKVGGTVLGAQVVKINRNAVILKTAERELTLKMSERPVQPILPPGSPAGRPGGAAPDSGPAVAPGSVVLSRSEVNSYLKDMGALLSTAQIRPYFSGGVPDGFMISNIRPDSIFQKIGVTNGDIIQGIDDRQIKTADDMVNFYNRLKSGSPMTLRLKRQGRQEAYQYTFR